MSAERALYPVPESRGTYDPVRFDEDAIAYADFPEQMWALPEVIADESLRELHARLISGMRRDAQHLPTGTLQAMQLERIAFYYILIRWREMQDNWTSDRERSSTYKLWRDLTTDFNQTAYGNKISPEDLHAIVATHTAKVVAGVLRTMPAEQARPLYAKFASALEAPDPN